LSHTGFAGDSRMESPAITCNPLPLNNLRGLQLELGSVLMTENADRDRLELLDVKHVAALLNVSEAAVRRLFLRRELPGRKIGKKWWTTRAAMARWLEGQD